MTAACAVAECGSPAMARGWCSMHYQRWRSHGDATHTPLRHGSPAAEERTCSVADCERILVPPHGRGMCGLHYKRWMRNGAPVVRRKRNVCAIDGCELLCEGRGWCSKHYTRWKRYGDPAHRLPGEVVDGKRVCPRCGVDTPTDGGWYKNAGTCAACCREYAASRPYVPVERTARACDACGRDFMADGRRNRYCSAECFESYKNVANWKHLNLRRARLRSVDFEAFDRFEIFERDAWICGLCGQPIPREARFPDPQSASIDHRTPVSLGGSHTRANVQAAHFRCNGVKGARLTEATA